jgi:hypothetical protein
MILIQSAKLCFFIQLLQKKWQKKGAASHGCRALFIILIIINET